MKFAMDCFQKWLKSLILLSLICFLQFCGTQKNRHLENKERSQLEANALYQLGLTALREKENLRALALFRRSGKLDQKNPSYPIFESIAMDRLGDSKKAEKLLRKTCEKFPKLGECQNTLASILLNQKMYQESLAISERVIEEEYYSSKETAWANMAQAQLNLGFVRDSLLSIERALKLNENLCDLRNLKAKILMHDLRYGTALEGVQRATLKCPRHWPTHAWEAFLLFKIGDASGARDKLMKIEKNFTGSEAKIYSYMALKRLEQGRAFEEPTL